MPRNSRSKRKEDDISKDTGSSSDDETDSGLDANLIDAIRIAVHQALKEERKEINENLSSIVNQLKELNKKYQDIEHSIKDCSSRLEQTLTEFLPNLNKKIVDISSALAIRVLDIDTHRRKWSLVVQGVPGVAGEAASVTRESCVSIAKTYLGVSDASTADMAACHRLNNQENASILIHFLDLDKRNRWLAGAKGLVSHPGKVSLSPDLPPVARQLKKEILQRRRELDADTKRISSVRYLKTFPYVQLCIRGKAPIQPKVTQQKLMESYLNVSSFIDMSLS